MSYDAFSSGKPVHCVELTTGKRLTGILRFGGDGIQATLVSYDGAALVPTDAAVVLLTEYNSVVSLHSNLSWPADSNLQLEPPREVQRQHIYSNIAVVGPIAWGGAEQVRRVRFVIDHSKPMLMHEAKVGALARHAEGDEEARELFAEAVEGATVRVGYSRRVSREYGPPTVFEINPSFQIEYAESVTIDAYLDTVLAVVRFCAFSMGRHMHPSSIWIGKETRAEWLQSINEGRPGHEFEVLYRWPEVVADGEDETAWGSPLIARNDDELTALRVCLVAWIGRLSEWSNAYELMMIGLRLRGEVSANRLLNAFKWFEEIPLTRYQAALSKDDAELIGAAAAAKGRELGYDLENRIVGALRTIRTEANEARFARLISLVTTRFGGKVLKADVVEHLNQAVAFRGRCAHRNFVPADDQEQLNFMRSVRALEALCYLLVALDLPIGRDGIGRIRRNKFVSDYLYMS